MKNHKHFFIFKLIIILLLVLGLFLFFFNVLHLKIPFLNFNNINYDENVTEISNSVINILENNHEKSNEYGEIIPLENDSEQSSALPNDQDSIPNNSELIDKNEEDSNNSETLNTNKSELDNSETLNTNKVELNNSETLNTNKVESDNSNTSYTNEPKLNNFELFSKYYDKANELLDTMTLEEKVGQMFLVRYPGTSQALQETASENPGGYILFGKDFSNKTKNGVISELTDLQNMSKINLFLAVDEEGGSVVRVSSYTNFRSNKFQSPQDLFKKGGLQAILEDSTEKSNLLKSLGLNMNLAPVVDIPTGLSSFIYSRSYGQNAENTAIYASELINRMNLDSMISSMKHFPGYGDNVDTHTGIAVDKRDYSVFEISDFLPFIRGIEAGAPTIMVNHNIINCMDSTKPASLSENVHKILREDLGFSGLIITDDLAMSAVKNYVSNGEAAVQAVLAGNDLIISSDFKAQKQEVLKAVQDGRISEELIDTAVRRTLACKLAYGIIEF